MKWIRDRSRRFEWRPYYHQEEIDDQCEEIVNKFFRDRGEPPKYPISTDDLTVMIERDVSELDLYANLIREGRDVQGVTEFYPRSKPSVRIAKYLSDKPSNENRQRSTLAHEYGHVIFHNFLWTMDPSRNGPLRAKRTKKPPKCHRAKIIQAPETDWMEWQAGYASGALLMPISAVRTLVDESFEEWGVSKKIESASENYATLIERIAETFGVSKAAAKTRISKLGYVASS